MRALRPLALGTVCVLVGSALAAPRGKVVRVERQREAEVAPRICEMQADASGVCFGPAPQVGEIVMVMNESGVLAETRVTDAVPFPTGPNQTCNVLWNIKSEPLRGDMSGLTRMFGVVDRDIHPRKGRLHGKDQLPPSPAGDGATVVVAVDRDGDREADIVLVQSDCDGTSSVPGGMCLDAWARQKGRMVRVQQTNFANCGL